INSSGRADKFVVEKVFEFAGAGLPAHLLDLDRAQISLGIPNLLGLVVVIGPLRPPSGADSGIEGPIGNIDTFYLVGHGLDPEFSRGEPMRTVPLSNLLANLRFAHFENKEALRPEHLLDLFIRNQGAGAAKIATLTNTALV